MTTVALLSLVERAGGILTLRDDRVVCEVPEDAAHFLPELRQRRDDVLRLLQQRLAENVRLWVAFQCVACPGCAANPRILHREFCRWGGLACSESAFLAEVRRLGFPLDDDDMVAGLALGADFVAACKYEHERCA